MLKKKSSHSATIIPFVQSKNNIQNVLQNMPYLFATWLSEGSLSAMIFVSKNVKFNFELSLISRKRWLLKTLLQTVPNSRRDTKVRTFFDEGKLIMYGYLIVSNVLPTYGM